MERFFDLLKQKEITAFILILCIILFTFPHFVLALSSQATVFGAFFGVWILAILLLFCFSRTFDVEQANEVDGEDDHV